MSKQCSGVSLNLDNTFSPEFISAVGTHFEV
jgi:hypothetical protein